MVIRSVHNTSDTFMFILTRQSISKVRQHRKNMSLPYKWGPVLPTESQTPSILRPKLSDSAVTHNESQHEASSPLSASHLWLRSSPLSLQSGCHFLVTWFPPHNGKIFGRNMWDSKIIFRHSYAALHSYCMLYRMLICWCKDGIYSDLQQSCVWAYVNVFSRAWKCCFCLFKYIEKICKEATDYQDGHRIN